MQWHCKPCRLNPLLSVAFLGHARQLVGIIKRGNQERPCPAAACHGHRVNPRRPLTAKIRSGLGSPKKKRIQNKLGCTNENFYCSEWPAGNGTAAALRSLKEHRKCNLDANSVGLQTRDSLETPQTYEQFMLILNQKPRLQAMAPQA